MRRFTSVTLHFSYFLQNILFSIWVLSSKLPPRTKTRPASVCWPLQGCLQNLWEMYISPSRCGCATQVFLLTSVRMISAWAHMLKFPGMASAGSYSAVGSFQAAWKWYQTSVKYSLLKFFLRVSVQWPAVSLFFRIQVLTLGMFLREKR